MKEAACLSMRAQCQYASLLSQSLKNLNKIPEKFSPECRRDVFLNKVITGTLWLSDLMRASDMCWFWAQLSIKTGVPAGRPSLPPSRSCWSEQQSSFSMTAKMLTLSALCFTQHDGSYCWLPSLCSERIFSMLVVHSQILATCEHVGNSPQGIK